MKNLVVNWTKFCTLSWQERRTLLVAMAWLPLFWFGLRILGLRHSQDWLHGDNVAGESKLSHDDIVRVARLVNIAARHVPFPSTCLTRSLLLIWMLRRRGVATELRIGVRLTPGALDAHAWVEHAGMPINDRPDIGGQFAPFAETLTPSSFQSP